MKLRTKTLAMICVVCTIFFIILISILHVVIMQSYLQLEEKIVSDNVKRVENQFNYEHNSLTSIGYDWSTWDDTYFFVEDANEQYIQTNLDYVIFEDIQINFMIFYNKSDSLVFIKAFDLYEKKEIILPSSLYSFIDRNRDLLLHHRDSDHRLSGIVLYDQEEPPLLVSVTPIIQSNKEGPIRGTLIIGRFLDEEKLDDFENITQLSLSISPLSNYNPSFFGLSSFSTTEKQISIQSKNATYIAGYTTITDVFGNPILLLEVGSDRNIYNQGLNVLQKLFIALVITTIFLILLTILVVEKFVTSKLTNFSKLVGEIQNFNDLTKKLEVKGNDEISLLGKNINDMLTSLQNIWSMKDSAELSLKKKIDELEKFKTLTIDREIKMIELKKQLQEFRTNRRRDDLG